MKGKHLIVGLGNPGAQYEYTRHNLGFLVVFKLAEMLKLKFSLSSFTNGLVAESQKDDDYLCLLMPLTYMNNSGKAIKPVIKTKEVECENILVVTDDLDLSFGQLRIRAKGSDGGHNGLGSIIDQLQTKQFNRLRIGIGKPTRSQNSVDYVLEEFNPKEKAQLETIVETSAECCKSWLENGIMKTMEQFNKGKTNE